MLKNNNEIKSRILSNISYFSEVDKIIAFSILNSTEKIDNINSFSKQINVSVASLTRFCNRIGFKGWKEFVFSLKHSAPISSSKIEQVSESYISEIKTFTTSSFEEEDVKLFIDAIHKNKIIFSYGMGLSKLASNDLIFRLSRVGFSILSIEEIDILKSLIVNSKGEKYILLFSLSGTKREIIELATLANKYKIKIISITSGDNKLSLMSDIAFNVSVNKNLHISSVSHQLPLLLFNDFIFSQFIEKYLNTIYKSFVNNIKELK